MVTLGILFMGIMGLFGSWRWMSSSAIFFCFLWAICLILVVPESPTFLIGQRQLGPARKALVVCFPTSFESSMKESFDILDLEGNGGG